MKAVAVLLAALALGAAARGAPDPGTALTAEGGEGDWKPLIDALASKGAVTAPFTERRYFPFRREPTQLHGILRISPERGLSLQYTDPEASILIADGQGLVLRDAAGRTRAVPPGSRQAGAIAALLPIMRFDLGALYPSFGVRATRSEAGWSFEFTPKEGDARALGIITVSGSGSEVRHLEFRKSASQRVEIDVAEARAGVAFSPEDLGRFFR